MSSKNVIHFIYHSPLYMWSFLLLIFSVVLQCLWLVSFNFFPLFTKSKHNCLNAGDIFFQKSGKAHRKSRILLDTWIFWKYHKEPFLKDTRPRNLSLIVSLTATWRRIRLIFIISAYKGMIPALCIRYFHKN